uniref:uncharacterized protein n=1 Tax=Pristiophorus japonicus TaxID=55135 RepID=UPI00398ECD16
MSLTAKEEALRWFEETQAPQLSQDGVLPRWFHGFASRREAEDLLKEKPVGSFLLRLSESQAGMVLSYSGSDRCRHFIIDQSPHGQYLILGDEHRHNSVTELLNYYRKVPILPFVEYLTTACNKEPDRHYAEIDRSLRRKLSDREPGEGADAGALPEGPQVVAGSTSLPGPPTFDPGDPKAVTDVLFWAVEGAAKITLDDLLYQEDPHGHYADIDSLRRKLSDREPGGGAEAGARPEGPQVATAPTPSPRAPTFDPGEPKGAPDVCLWAMEVAVKVTLDDPLYQEIPEARALAVRAAVRPPSPCPPEREICPAPSQGAATYAAVNKARRHIYTEPGERPGAAKEETHTYAEPAQARVYADPDLAVYAEPQDLGSRAVGPELYHVYSELEPSPGRRGNFYCPTPTKGPTPDLPPRLLPALTLDLTPRPPPDPTLDLTPRLLPAPTLDLTPRPSPDPPCEVLTPDLPLRPSPDLPRERLTPKDPLPSQVPPSAPPRAPPPSQAPPRAPPPSQAPPRAPPRAPLPYQAPPRAPPPPLAPPHPAPPP